jgi:uncharacterized protein YjbI with pentapeptide repeats
MVGRRDGVQAWPVDAAAREAPATSLRAPGFSGTRLERVRLVGADLAGPPSTRRRGAELATAELFRVGAVDCDARRASFRKVGFVHAGFAGADLEDADPKART